MSVLPACTRTCGIFMEDAELIDALAELSWEVEPPFTPIQCRPEDALCETRVDGK